MPETSGQARNSPRSVVARRQTNRTRAQRTALRPVACPAAQSPTANSLSAAPECRYHGLEPACVVFALCVPTIIEDTGSRSDVGLPRNRAGTSSPELAHRSASSQRSASRSRSMAAVGSRWESAQRRSHERLAAPPQESVSHKCVNAAIYAKASGRTGKIDGVTRLPTAGFGDGLRRRGAEFRPMKPARAIAEAIFPPENPIPPHQPPSRNQQRTAEP